MDESTSLLENASPRATQRHFKAVVDEATMVRQHIDRILRHAVVQHEHETAPPKVLRTLIPNTVPGLLHKIAPAKPAHTPTCAPQPIVCKLPDPLLVTSPTCPSHADHASAMLAALQRWRSTSRLAAATEKLVWQPAARFAERMASRRVLRLWRMLRATKGQERYGCSCPRELRLAVAEGHWVGKQTATAMGSWRRETRTGRHLEVMLDSTALFCQIRHLCACVCSWRRITADCSYARLVQQQQLRSSVVSSVRKAYCAWKVQLAMLIFAGTAFDAWCAESRWQLCAISDHYTSHAQRTAYSQWRRQNMSTREQAMCEGTAALVRVAHTAAQAIGRWLLQSASLSLQQYAHITQLHTTYRRTILLLCQHAQARATLAATKQHWITHTAHWAMRTWKAHSIVDKQIKQLMQRAFDALEGFVERPQMGVRGSLLLTGVSWARWRSSADDGRVRRAVHERQWQRQVASKAIFLRFWRQRAKQARIMQRSTRMWVGRSSRGCCRVWRQCTADSSRMHPMLAAAFRFHLDSTRRACLRCWKHQAKQTARNDESVCEALRSHKRVLCCWALTFWLYGLAVAVRSDQSWLVALNRWQVRRVEVALALWTRVWLARKVEAAADGSGCWAFKRRHGIATLTKWREWMVPNKLMTGKAMNVIIQYVCRRLRLGVQTWRRWAAMKARCVPETKRAAGLHLRASGDTLRHKSAQGSALRHLTNSQLVITENPLSPSVA